MKQNAAKYKKKHRIRKLLVIAVSFTIIIAGGRSLLSRLPAGLLSKQAVPEEQVNGGGLATANLYSKHGILIERKTGDVVWKTACDSKTWPASLTKIMTVLAAIEETSDLRKKVTLPEDIYPALYSEKASMAGFLPGETVRVIDLLYGSMLPSGAEASATLARYVSGTQEAFVALMNQKANQLGMTGTHYENVTGLHHPNHYTTAADTAKLLRYALQNKTFRAIFTAERYSIPPTNLHPSGITFHSTLSQNADTLLFNGGKIIGGKTGYTQEAQLCLASLAVKNGKEYILVTTGAPGSHETAQFNILDAISLYSHYAK